MWGCKGISGEQWRDILSLTECYRLKGGDLVHLTKKEAEAGTSERGGLTGLRARTQGTLNEKLGGVTWQNGDNAGDTAHSSLSLARRKQSPVSAHPNICS